MLEEREIPTIQYEELVRKVCGPSWRSFPDDELDGALGVAIVKSILDGCTPSLEDVSAHLGLDKHLLRSAYLRLNANGIFRQDRIHNDRRALESGDIFPWCYYAGYASGATQLCS